MFCVNDMLLLNLKTIFLDKPFKTVDIKGIS